MKNSWKELVLAFVLAWGMPWVVLAAAQVVFEQEQPQETQPAQPTEPIQTQSVKNNTLQVWTEEGCVEMELSEYLTGVLISEMPDSFHMEAKMAQAVVARTYALRRVGAMDKHPGAVCTDSSCCQGYLNPSTFENQKAVTLARQAVERTEGLVLTYEDELIDATYFSCSGGMTEDAVAVWGSDVPYLQSVESPGEEIAAHYTDTLEFNKAQLEQALGVTLKGRPKSWLGTVTYTEGGGVASIVIGGKICKGTEVRALLGLRSTAFTVTAGEETITITTRGYGHRVGMSQYGAQAMALRGSSFAQILAHYYQGAVLTQWRSEEK